ncbi:hypothetical protein ASD64_09125 [Mesorhizobium sp. Root157]|uniref:DUF5131 family protein n=1 Tax=Mesorhizobium sp. Root157 TaxID=1736477 RepID=UPI0006F9884F|nr:phage Gp37/Gp68 family protein [Mesorhizobium sp. Root157]KQZ81905.1 hypothetical protein ASD64_09125 [Mesorhizobium sp. Root157]
MADHSHIEWTDATWNPVTGCSVVSPGCTNCYAMKLAGTRLQHHPSREGLTRDSKAGPVWTGEVRFNEQWLDQPLRWKSPRMIFVCAHGDLFHESVPDEWIDRVFAVMALAPQHTFQVLTKRAARMRAYLASDDTKRRIYELACDWAVTGVANVVLIAPGIADPGLMPSWPRVHLDQWPLPNVWLGVSAEDQQRANERIPALLATPSAVRFVSAEPLLGAIDFEQAWYGENALDSECWGDCAWCDKGYPALHNCQRGKGDWEKGRSGLDWIIVGGESGRDARPMHPDWARSIRDQCAAAGVPFFFKQWGSWAPICAMSEEQVDGCFKPVRVARAGEDQHTLNDIYGRFEIKTSHVLHVDGSRHDALAPNAFLRHAKPMTMYPIGKSAAGRKLDDREHNGMPQRREVPFQ